MQARHLNFTKKAIEQLPIPEKKTLYHDTKVRGLKLKIRPSGLKSFMFYRKINGYPESIMLGAFPEITVENARNIATKFNLLVAQGVNPAEEKRAIRKEMTFGEFFDQYIEQHAKPYKKTYDEDIRCNQCYLQAWRNLKLSAIKKNTVQRLHTKIGTENGQYMANRVLTILQTVFNKAREWGWDHPNPATGIKRYPEKSRERFLQADELPRFFQAVQEEPNDVIRDFILLCLFTGARCSNVMAMRWEEINFKNATWRIPETKHGGAHTVPLSPAAIEILERRKLNVGVEWVLPGSGETGHLVSPQKGWERVLARAEIENLHIHDLRRSLGSWQAATGASLSVIGKTLAHKNVSTTAIYARLNLDPVRESVLKATEAMLTAGMVIQENNDA